MDEPKNEIVFALYEPDGRLATYKGDQLGHSRLAMWRTRDAAEFNAMLHSDDVRVIEVSVVVVEGKVKPS